MSDDLVKRWDDYVESMGCVMGEVEHTAQQMRDRIEELSNCVAVLEAKLKKVVGLAEKSIRWLRLYGIDVHREAATLAELTGDKDE